MRMSRAPHTLAHSGPGFAVVKLPCSTIYAAGRRMVGPPIRPKPATPHSALIPKGIGYGRENVTVSHAPPGTITKRSGYPEARTPAPSARPASPSFRVLIARSLHGARRPRRLSTEIVGRTNRPATRRGGAWWGLPSGRSREPHIALESRKGTGYGRENVTVSHAPPGTITKRCGCRGAGTPAPSGDTNLRGPGGRDRGRQRIEHLGSGTCRSPFRRVAVSRPRRTDRTLFPVAPEPRIEHFRRIEQQIEHQIEQGDRTGGSNTCRPPRRGSTSRPPPGGSNIFP